jgi:hypothetical protein
MSEIITKEQINYIYKCLFNNKLFNSKLFNSIGKQRIAGIAVERNVETKQITKNLDIKPLLFSGYRLTYETICNTMTKLIDDVEESYFHTITENTNNIEFNLLSELNDIIKPLDITNIIMPTKKYYEFQKNLMSYKSLIGVDEKPNEGKPHITVFNDNGPVCIEPIKCIKKIYPVNANIYNIIYNGDFINSNVENNIITFTNYSKLIKI